MEDLTPMILVVDNDQAIRDHLATLFEEAGYRVALATNGTEGFDTARTCNPNLVLIDLLLPMVDGYTLCRQLRQFTQVPIILMSALQDELHLIAGFELGANDIVTKPLRVGELLARVRSLLYWHHAHQTKPFTIRTATSAMIDVGLLRIDPVGRRAWRNSQEVELTHIEFDLLVYMMNRSNIALSRSHLMEQIWADSFHRGLRTIDVHIHSLREKIEEDPASPKLIQTVRNVGYRFLGSASASAMS